MLALLDTQSTGSDSVPEQPMAESLSLHGAVKQFVNDGDDVGYCVQPEYYEPNALRDLEARFAAAHDQATGEA